MGIEILTYDRESNHPEHNKDYQKGFIDGVRALRSHQENEWSLPYTLEATCPENILGEPLRLLVLPRSLPTLVNYLCTVPPSRTQVVLGFLQDEIVYVNLNYPIAVQDGPPFQGNVILHDIGELALGTDWSDIRPSTLGYCVGCIEGTGTALIFVVGDHLYQWFLWTPEGAVQEAWKGMT